jgi:hypothetical protein
VSNITPRLVNRSGQPSRIGCGPSPLFWQCRSPTVIASYSKARYGQCMCVIRNLRRPGHARYLPENRGQCVRRSDRCARQPRPVRLADERIALSRHRTGTPSTRRSTRFVRRSGIILPAAGVAVIGVAAVSVAAWLMGPSVSGASGAAQALEAIPNSKTVALLEQERRQMIVMSAASRTLTVVAKPKVASPASAVASANLAASGGVNSGATTGDSAPPPTCWAALAFPRHNSAACRACGTGKAAGAMTRRIHPARPEFHRHCPRQRWHLRERIT